MVAKHKADGRPSEGGAVIRLAQREDAAEIFRLIRELADFEGLAHEVKASESDILRDGFGEQPRFECLLAEQDGRAVGFALFFYNYSTFEGAAGLYLEDLFVTPELRGRGIGKALLARLATLAVERSCARLDLWVLHWNPARDFYHRLGIKHLSDWLPYRLTGEPLRQLAAADTGD